MARLNVFDKNGNVDIQKKTVKWDGLLAKLVAQVGLMTPLNHATYSAERTDLNDDDDIYVTPEFWSWNVNPNQEAVHDLSDGGGGDSDFEPQPESESDNPTEESDGDSESEVDSDQVFHPTAISATTSESQDGVRRLARLRVYNMAYLHPSRAFGPFLPLETSTSGAVVGEEEILVDHHDPMRLGSPLTAVPPILLIPDNDSESFLSTVAGAIRSDLDLGDIDISRLFGDNDGNVIDETVGNPAAATASGPSSFLHFPYPTLVLIIRLRQQCFCGFCPFALAHASH